VISDLTLYELTIYDIGPSRITSSNVMPRVFLSASAPGDGRPMFQL
jgi:hypothetical protein